MLSFYKRIALAHEALAESDVTLRPFVVNTVLHFSIDLHIVQVIDIYPGAAIVLIDNFALYLSYLDASALGVIDGMIADAPDNISRR